MSELLQKSATALARMIREGEISSREAVKAHIDRIEAINPSLNAVVVQRFEAALEEADRADARVRENPLVLPPFWGVPCTIKECFALRGMPNSAGSVARRDVYPERDATAVDRLRRAGAIPMGVTNVSELCMWYESYNHVYGRTRNPYDPERIVGGSSGGEGAIIGAGGSPFGLGSDIGGSIRLPAFFNGVFGHKPSGGLVPGTGQHPSAHGPALRYLTTGPLARRAEDLMPLLRTLAGPDGEDTGCLRHRLGDPDQVKIEGLTVLDVAPPGRLSDELVETQARAAAALAERGARVERIEIPALKDAVFIWSALLSAAGGESFESFMAAGRPWKLREEIPRWMARRTEHTFPALGLVALERLTKRLSALDKRYIEAAAALKEDLGRRLAGESVMLFPTFPRTALKHREPYRNPFSFGYTAILNVLELQATQVPMGLGEGGLPTGLQVVAAWGEDHRAIAVARALEEAADGWVMPPR